MSSDPLALFSAVTDALGREDWRATASLCDPASLSRFKRYLVEQFEATVPPRHFTVETYMRHDPEMPLEVAEYHVAKIKRARDPTEHLANELSGIGNVEELQALSPRDVFAAWLKARSPRHQLDRLVARGEIAQEMGAEMANVSGLRLDCVALGAVADGEDLSHILFRQAFRGMAANADEVATEGTERLSREEQVLARDLAGREHPQVSTCRRQPDGEWRMVAGHSFPGFSGFGISMGS